MTGNSGPAGNGEGDRTGNGDEAERRAREDAAWQSIVDHYGERPDFVPPEAQRDREPEREPEQPPELGPRSWEPVEEDDRYIPPPPPPVPRPHGLRLAAWLGLFGVPTVVLFCIVAGVSLPSPLGFLALVWFVGSFGYLVATMTGPKDPGGGWDDGAVV